MTFIEHPSPNHSPRPAGTRVDTIILHHTATSSDGRGTMSAVGWLSARDSKASAHYVIGHDGKVFRLVREERAAWHAGESRLAWETSHKPGNSLNWRSIGIELVNPGDGATPFTEAQYRALEALLPGIVKRLGNTPLVLNGWKHSMRPPAPPHASPVFIFGHRDVACFRSGRLGRKTDPADNFDWDRVLEMLKARVA